MTTQGTTGPPDPRVVEANALKAQAEARKAEVEADAAARSEAEAASDGARRQREAEANKATAEADKAARDAAENVDPALTRRQKEAEVKKATAEAEKAAAEARQARIAALIPDFSKVQVPEMKIGGDQVLRGNQLARHAMRHAAGLLATRIAPCLSTGAGSRRPLVLLTTDAELATTDGAYVEVKHGLDRLTSSADALVPAKAGFAAAAAAIASAIPGVISMLAPHTTLTSQGIADDDTAAVASVGGELARTCDVRIDTFRLVPTNVIVAAEHQLRERRDRVAKFKLEKDAVKSAQEALRTSAQERLNGLRKVKDDPPTGGPPENLDTNIREARSHRDEATQAAANASVAADMAGALLDAIDGFFGAIHTVPQGASRSPFVAAALHEELRAGAGTQFDAVIFIKGAGGSVDQRIEEIFFKRDRIESDASVSISYWIMNPASSNILTGGVVTATARLSGKMGETLTISVVPSEGD